MCPLSFQKPTYTKEKITTLFPSKSSKNQCIGFFLCPLKNQEDFCVLKSKIFVSLEVCSYFFLAEHRRDTTSSLFLVFLRNKNNNKHVLLTLASWLMFKVPINKNVVRQERRSMLSLAEHRVRASGIGRYALKICNCCYLHFI